MTAPVIGPRNQNGTSDGCAELVLPGVDLGDVTVSDVETILSEKSTRASVPMNSCTPLRSACSNPVWDTWTE